MSPKFILLALTAIMIIALPINLTTGSAVLISDMTMSVMVELSSRHPFCRMHTDRGDIQRMLLSADQRRIRQVPRESVMELEDVCKNSGSYGHEFRGGLGFIYPGTKWCGPGTSATDYNDLGQHADEDRCCREHDLCPNVLNVGECRRGLCNTGTFTRSHCDCDARFRRCLQTVNSETANTLGAIFYNVVQVTCFQERSPCSPQQRYEDFFYRTAHCDIEFRRAEIYVPPNAENLITKIVTHPYGLANNFLGPEFGKRAYQKDSGLGVLKEFTRSIGVKLVSVGIAAINIFREIIQRPQLIWDSLKVPVSKTLPEDISANDIAQGYYYNMPENQKNSKARSDDNLDPTNDVQLLAST